MPSASPPKGPGDAEISQLNLSKPKLTGDIVPPGNITQRKSHYYPIMQKSQPQKGRCWNEDVVSAPLTSNSFFNL